MSAKGIEMWARAGSTLAIFMFFWAIISQYLPPNLKLYFENTLLYSLFSLFDPYVTITINEFSGDHLKEFLLLDLVTTIKDQACEIYKKVEDQKPLRGRNQDAICAACLYLACRIGNKACSIAEIYSAANGATKKVIGRASDFIKKQFDGEGQTMEVGTVQARDLLRRFCSKLRDEIKAAHEAMQKAEELDFRRIPKTDAAAVIYIISQLSSNQISLKDISTTTEVAEGTIKNSYKDLQPYLLRIIPSWYANEHEIKRLARP